MATFFITVLLAGLLIGFGCYHRYKPLPAGISDETAWYPADDARFLIDHRYVDARGRSRMRREIAPAMLAMIAGARERIVLDAFLFNPHMAHRPEQVPVAEALTCALVHRCRACPQLHVTVVVDPINSYYGAQWPDHFRRLQAAGVEVVETPLARLRDSNPVWSVPWRLVMRPWGNRVDGGWLPNPIGPGRITLRSWLALLNFRANHRKVMIADCDGDWQGLVASGNPHDASSTHTNVAVRFSGNAARALLDQEHALIALAKGQSPLLRSFPRFPETPPGNPPRLRILTESRIREAALALIREAQSGDSLDFALFYLSHRRIIRAIRDAHRRGCQIRLLLDPNKDAFGRVKGGLPNRQVAMELHRQGIRVRWYRTHGEQFHCKYLRRETRSGDVSLIAGSANFTRRNLDDLNLETACQIQGREDESILRTASDWFERCWCNPPGFQCSVPYGVWADERRLRYLVYRFAERSGWSSF